jgi:hypothetical protein
MTLEEVAHLVKTALPKGRHHDIQASILPHALSTDELCAAESWIRFVLAEEVTHRLWVAFVDEEPGRAWDHRSRLILVDDEIAEVLIDLSMHFCPSLVAQMQPLR